MTATAAPIELVKTIYAAVGAGDLEAVLALLHPDFELEQSSALPFAGTFRGADGFKALGAAIYRAWPDFAVTPTAFAPVDDGVLVVTHLSGSNPDGSAPLDQQMIEYWRVAEGKAIGCRPFYFDPVAAARSAGATVTVTAPRQSAGTARS